VKVLPVIFMRHPIDRIASAYAFERKQGGDTFGAVLARNTDFKGYVETRLALPNDRQCRNFHMQRLAAMFGEKQGDEVARANMALENLPFVGIVEEFSDSLERLEDWLNVEGLQSVKIQPVKINVSRNARSSFSEKLHVIKAELGAEVWGKLLDANEADMQLYKRAVMRKEVEADG
jgi:hypothetical protein